MTAPGGFEIGRVSHVRDILREYGIPRVEDDAVRKILLYTDLLRKWRRKISLTTISAENEILRFHFGESVFALKIAEMDQGRLADVGSGAGFPGIPLKILQNGLSVWLIERNKKKCAFLHEIVRELELDDMHIVPVGYEESGIEADSLDFVVSRAVGDTEDLAKWCFQKARPGGKLVLWSGAEDLREIREMHCWTWEAPKKIPNSRERFIMVGRHDIEPPLKCFT